MDEFVIKGGTLIDASGERIVDVAISAGRISAIAQNLSGEVALDASGCVVSPGFVDLHVHLRQPGKEEAETVETGSRAAALGGFTAVVAMPNTEPAQDSVAVVEQVRRWGVEAGLCEVLPSGCLTLGRAGERMAPIGELASVGVRIFTDDGNGVQDPLLMRRIMEYSLDLDVVLAQHCEVSRLTAGAVMHEGCCSSHLGLPGWPSLAEELMVHRDIELARLTGARVHFLHLSTVRSVQLVRAAKADGLRVTAEAAPHHFTLTDELLRTFDATYKVNPPLRTAEDIAAIKAGLRDGTIDAIATDHAPHPKHQKEQSLDQAPPGMLGLQTALSLALGELDLDLPQVIALLSSNPAAIAGVSDRHGGPLAVGRPANITVFDPSASWTVDATALASKSTNTPYAGRTMRGLVRHTLLSGVPVVRDGEALR